MGDIVTPENIGAAMSAWAGRKLLGPLLGDIAEGWKQRHEEYRRRNFERIIEKAAQKAGEGLNEPGAVHPRVGAEIFDRGSWCDDELMAEYLGGVLAASRTADGEDDRGAFWASLVTRLSVYQVRLHYVLYTVARELLLPDPVNVNSGTELGKKMPLYVPTSELLASMGRADPHTEGEIVLHSLRGLQREGLLGDEWALATPDFFKETFPLRPARPIPEHGLVCSITSHGAELYVWAHGFGTAGLDAYLDAGAEFSVEPSVEACPSACLVADLPPISQ